MWPLRDKGAPPSTSRPLRVHAIAIGRADALVIELPSGRLEVIDFGHSALLDHLDVLDPQRQRRYAFALLTHTHYDHYRCLPDFIARHNRRVEQYWLSKRLKLVKDGCCALMPPGADARQDARLE